MKRHFEECMDLAESGDWAALLETLSPWRDDAPNQLWAVIEFLAEQEPETGNWNHTQKLTPTRAQKCYDTKALATMFSQLSKDGYSAVSLGLIVDLVEQLKEKEN